MEHLDFQFTGGAPAGRRAYAGVVGSGDLEVLLTPGNAGQIDVAITTSVNGMSATWQAQLARVFGSHTWPAAKIIINPRTGSVVMNQAVTIGPCAVAHGNLTVTVTSNPQVSQPNAMSNGQTVVTDRPDIQVKQDGGALMTVPAGTKLSDVVKALNALGANPADLMSILQAMKAAGAINAELEVI